MSRGAPSGLGRRVPSPLIPTVVSAMEKWHVLEGDIRVFCGWIHTESGFDPWAIRAERNYRWLYPRDHPPAQWSTEWWAQKASWGLLQVMGAVGREQGVTGYLSRLLEPELNLDIACRILLRNRNALGSWEDALAAYNGGLGGYGNPGPRSYVHRVYANGDLF